MKTRQRRVSNIMSLNDPSLSNPPTPSSGQTPSARHSDALPLLQKARQNAAIWGLLLLTLFVFFWRLGSVRLFDLDEGIYVSASKQMVLSGDYITPQLNTRPLRHPSLLREPFYEKPIVVYLLCAGSMRLFGTSEWAARLPVALAGLLATWMLVGMGWQWFGRRAGLLTGLVYATSPMILVDSRQMTTDNLVALWFLGAMYAFWSLYRQTEPGVDALRHDGVKDQAPGTIENRNSKIENTTPHLPITSSPHHSLAFLFWGMCALAVLTKGAIGLLLPGLVIGVTLLLRALTVRLRWGKGRSPLLLFRLGLNRIRDWWPGVGMLQPVLGILFFLILVVPWHLAIWKAGGHDANDRTWFQEYIGIQHVGRFKGVDTVHNAPLPTFFAYFLLGFFPWACFTPAAYRLARTEDSRQRQTHRFLLIWFWTIFVFFSLGAAKLPTYIAPAYPAAALLVGRWLDGLMGADEESTASAKRSLERGILGAWITAAILLAVGLLTALQPRLSALAPPQVIQLILLLTGTLFVGSFAAWLCFRHKSRSAGRRRAGMGLLIAMMLAVVWIFSGAGYDAANRYLLGPYQDLAARAEADGRRGMTVIFYHIVPRRPSMLYYAGNYSPLEHEPPLLPFLKSLQPGGPLEAEIVTQKTTLDSQLKPELAADPAMAFEVIEETGEGKGRWVLLHVHSR